VCFHGVLGQAQPAADGAVRVALTHAPQDLHLTLGQSGTPVPGSGGARPGRAARGEVR
jgi:hypothetical protein